METPGLSFIEAMVQCPTNYGRRNKFKQVLDQVEYHQVAFDAQAEISPA